MKVKTMFTMQKHILQEHSTSSVYKHALRWVYTPGATAMRGICDVAFNIDIPSQQQSNCELMLFCYIFRSIGMDWKVGERFRRQRESGGKPHETTEK
jgi:hypothetical protein